MTKTECTKMHEVEFYLVLTPEPAKKTLVLFLYSVPRGSRILSRCMPYRAQLDYMHCLEAVGNWELRDATWTLAVQLTDC